MKEVKSSPIKSAPKTTGQVEIVSVNYHLHNLVISLADEEKSILVIFDYAIGFRVLDEGNLLEFWPSCSLSNGCVFQIEEGGWFEQESERKGSLMSEVFPEAEEYMISGINDCVSVISTRPPQIVTRNIER